MLTAQPYIKTSLKSETPAPPKCIEIPRLIQSGPARLVLLNGVGFLTFFLYKVKRSKLYQRFLNTCSKLRTVLWRSEPFQVTAQLPIHLGALQIGPRPPDLCSVC